MPKIVILVPIYLKDLPALDEYSLDYSLSVLNGKYAVRFIGPVGLDCSYYYKRYPGIEVVFYQYEYFKSIKGYSRLLLNTEFYEGFKDFEFLLILQTDAILINDEIDYWINQPFDYIGAPWPDPFELFLNIDIFSGDNGKIVRANVGNGGLSLRRISKTISLLNEYPQITDFFIKTGSSEDLFFAVAGHVSKSFLIPNEIIASKFSLELRPEFYFSINGGIVPMGGHAWFKYNRSFWDDIILNQA